MAFPRPIFLLAACTALLGAVHAADITITAKGVSANKQTISLAALRADDSAQAREFLQILKGDLVRSGWFVPVDAPSASVVLEGAVQGGGGVSAGATVKWLNGMRQFGWQKSASHTQIRDAAHALSDKIVATVAEKKPMASSKILLVGRRGGSTEVYQCDADGARLQQLTSDGKLQAHIADLAHAEPVAGGEAFEALIERQLKNSDAALGRKPDDAQAKKGRRKVTTYDLDMLNVESRFEIPRIVEALKARGHGALCFYGAPGTGKTALGEYIAEHLGQPLIIKQASDLVSKYVGETEQNMAAMFKEATEEKAVLLLDEADSFLMDRRGAHRTYEVTEVNEMLQQMERHHGVFICTTNLLDRIDQAALRRFTFKIKFMPLKPEQREQMFITEALGGKADLMTPDVRRRLSKLEQLAPGDFAAVKRQTDILAAEFSVEEFLEQLEAEHRIKPEVREQRGIGFVH